MNCTSRIRRASCAVPIALFLIVTGASALEPVRDVPNLGPLGRRLRRAAVLVAGDLENQDCRTGVCQHNENTDLVVWRGDVYLVHRTAGSQVLGPNSSLRVYKSRNRGRTFVLQAIIPAPLDRDIRDPSFYEVG